LKLAQELVEAPITGKIISVEVKDGDTVSEGDVICFIESMKMENPILAPVSGTIAEINVSVGQQVETDDPIVTIEY
jgi:biotin carboxyl carrier protein